MDEFVENTDFEMSSEPGGIQKRRPYLKKFMLPDSDEDVPDMQKLYNVQESWRTLLQLPTCQKVMITDSVQKALKIQVGVNVTQEFPWKQLQYKDLRDVLFEELENAADLIKLFKGFNPENFVLIGYCPTLTEAEEDPPEGDPFIFYISSKDTKLAMGIIQNMEAFERWRMQRRLRKKPRRWVSMGTEQEMNILVENIRDVPVDVEIQSVYPIQQPRHIAYERRLARDVRDGVIELLPNESVKYDNIIKRRISVSVQVAPACVTQEQQTNPTFPSNAWSQYLYELDDADLELDESEKEEEEAGVRSRPVTPAPEDVVPKPPPEMSDQMKLLLDTLDFNQIDSYRNDYQLISTNKVVLYSNPFLQEFICFANISKSDKRYVASCDWYPSMSGLLAVSYAFSTPATSDLATHNVNFVQRAVLEPNPVLLWSFADNLNYKLEFEAPFEVTKLSFCPFNGDILIGGCQNGLLVLWDLQGRCEHLEEEEYLTPAQAKYRAMIGEFLDWTLDINEEVVVEPTIISPLESSPTGAITGIHWLSRHFYLNNFGKVFTDQDKRNHHKFFITCAFDGTVSFWNLDFEATKKGAQQRDKNLPKELTQNESMLKNKTIKPMYSLSYNEPLTGIIADTSVFSMQTPSPKVIYKSPANYPVTMVAKNPPELRQSLILSTYYGHIIRVEWQGMYSEAGAKEQVNSSINFAMVHDGPIVAVSKNPFYPEMFVSIGRTVFALWKEDYHDSPIIWRKRPCDLTAVAWSESRPAVLYITRNDGILEAWDILARDDDAVLTEVLGGGIITSVTEHRPSLPNKILGIGDYNSSIRMVKLPHSFDVPLDNELAKLMKYVLRQISRKISIRAWEQKYYELNKDIIEAKRQAEEEARKEMERLEREQQNIRKRPSDAEEDADGKGKKLGGAPYNERMAKKFDELNLNRMMTILMSRKQMDPEKLARETALEKERLSYETAKKESHARLLQTVDEDVATIRSRILPAEIPDMQRSEMIAERVKNEMAMAQSYESVCEEAAEKLKNFPELKSIDYIELLERGMQRRQLLDQSLGGNTDRLLWYKEKLRDNQIFECDFGVDLLYNRRPLGPFPKVPSEESQAVSQEQEKEIRVTGDLEADVE
ncbi:hypothetical protein ACLKA6_004720 [Drosophila palustris]